MSQQTSTTTQAPASAQQEVMHASLDTYTHGLDLNNHAVALLKAGHCEQALNVLGKALSSLKQAFQQQDPSSTTNNNSRIGISQFQQQEQQQEQPEHILQIHPVSENDIAALAAAAEQGPNSLVFFPVCIVQANDESELSNQTVARQMSTVLYNRGIAQHILFRLLQQQQEHHEEQQTTTTTTTTRKRTPTRSGKHKKHLVSALKSLRLAERAFSNVMDSQPAQEPQHGCGCCLAPLLALLTANSLCQVCGEEQQFLSPLEQQRAKLSSRALQEQMRREYPHHAEIQQVLCALASKQQEMAAAA